MRFSAFAVLAVAGVATAASGVLPLAAAADLAGRYVVASIPPLPNATVADAIYGGTLALSHRRQTYAAAWQFAALSPGTRRLRGIGLTDGDGTVLGISLTTGGQAYGVGIYRHNPAAHEWQGRWITSLDNGSAAGEIRFDDAEEREGGALVGRHRLTCRRPGSGSFEGVVTIAAAGDHFRLTFEAGHAVLYRGVGLRLAGDRLIVGWSFGSAPALAAYQIGADGLLTGSRISLRDSEPLVAREALAREGADAARLLPVSSRSPADPTLMPGSPQVKSWNYEDLMDHYSAEGWATRWLDGQLTAEERALLNRALRHQHARLAKGRPPEHRTIGDLIEEERSGKSRMQDRGSKIRGRPPESSTEPQPVSPAVRPGP